MSTAEMSAGDRLAILETTVATNPDDVQARLRLITALIEAGRAVEAMVHAETITSAVPDDPDGHRAAATCCESIGDPRAAAFRRVAAALDGYDEEAVPDVWVGVAPELATVAKAGRPTPSAEPQTDEPADAPTEAPSTENLPDPARLEHPRLAFRNIIGVDTLKRQIHQVVLRPIRERPSRPMPGILMFGPPGCGKRFFAKTIAGELRASFLPVDIATMATWVGDPREHIHRLFAAARAAAPCVLFLNDIECAGMRPDDSTGRTDRRAIARLTAELTNGAGNVGLTVIAGSTAPWDVDVALRAGGGLARTLLVAPPDSKAREAILRYRFQQVRLSGIDVAWVVDRTQHFSGNDLLGVCDRAVMLAAQEADGGTPVVGPGHMTRALREVRPAAPGWFTLAVEHAATANHAGMYDTALAYVEENNLV